MVDRPRLHKEDELERARRHASSPGRRDESGTPAVLDLQHAAGNQAVVQLLASGDEAVPTVQRDEADASAGLGKLSIPDLKLDLPISSFQRESKRPNQAPEPGGDVVVTFDKKHFDPRLMKALTDGRRFATITVEISGRKITLNDVFLSSLNVGTDVVTMSLHCGSIEFPGEGSGESESGEGWGR